MDHDIYFTASGYKSDPLLAGCTVAVTLGGDLPNPKMLASVEEIDHDSAENSAVTITNLLCKYYVDFCSLHRSNKKMELIYTSNSSLATTDMTP